MSASDSAAMLGADLLEAGGDAAAAKSQRYLAFISYRRRDGLPVARWLRQRIGTFDPPRELRQQVAELDTQVGGRFNRVFLDMSYQRSHANFWEDHIGPSVQRSEKLLLLLTPSVFEKLPGGEPNWVEREIETFLDVHGDPSRIMLVLGPGAPDDRVPDILARVSGLWDWADLRFFSSSTYVRWRKAADYDAQLTKILAAVYNINDGQLPALTREFERARAKVQRRVYVAGCATILGLSGLTAWALVERGRAVVAEHTALEQRDEAVRQRNAALVAQSLHLTETARVFRRDGSAREAMMLLRPALPEPDEGNDRPVVSETVAETYQTLYGDREIGRIALPEKTTAASESVDGKRLAAITPGGVVLMSMPDGKIEHRLTNGGGDARFAQFSSDGTRLLILDADGAVRVVDLTKDGVVARHQGLGPGASVRFAAHDSKVAVQSASRDDLLLLDVASGTAAERKFQRALPLFVGDDGETLLIAADGALRQLSTADVADVVTRPLADASYVAITKIPHGDIVMATGKDPLTGSLAILDPKDLSEKQSFRLTLGNVTGVEISTDTKTIAVHTPPNLTFYERATGFPQSAETVSEPDGRFVGPPGNQGYLVARYGVIQIFAPGKNLSTSYKSEDEADLRDIVYDADGLAFTTITSTPLVTRWSAKDVAVRQPLIRQKVLNGQEFSTLYQYVWTGAASHDGGRLAVDYLADGSLGIWDLKKAELIETIDSDQKSTEKPILAFSPNGHSVLRTAGNGTFTLFDLAGKSARTFQVGDKPIFRMQFLDGEHLAVEPQDGNIFELDIGGGEPRAEKLDALAGCGQAIVKNTSLICMADGGAKLFDMRQERLLWKIQPDKPSPSPYAFGFFPNSDRIAMVDGNGLLSVRSATTGEEQWEMQLTSKLSGPIVVAAINSPLIDDAARAAIKAGATEVSVRLPANVLFVSPDEKYAAIAFPNRTVQLVDLNARSVRETMSFDEVPRWIDFSAHGSQIAILSSPAGQDVAGQLKVYDFGLGQIIFSKSDLISDLSQVFHVGDGQGFVVVAPPRGVTLFPIWEKVSDLVAAISHKYPERLTANQRHFFHVD